MATAKAILDEMLMEISMWKLNMDQWKRAPRMTGKSTNGKKQRPFDRVLKCIKNNLLVAYHAVS